MVLFDDLATMTGGAYETSYKVSVAGCGKTALDVSINKFYNIFLYHILPSAFIFKNKIGDVWCIDNAPCTPCQSWTFV